MKIKKILLLIAIGMFCFMPVVNAKDDVIIKNIKLVEADENIVSNSKDKISTVFNDLGQNARYKLTLQNNTNKDLYVNDLQIDGTSQKFIKYALEDKSRSKIIKANSKEEIYLTISAAQEKGAGRNLNDTINFKFLLNGKIENPNTSSNLITTIILVIISAVAITFIMTKFNNKKGTIATVIVCFMLLGTSFVFADDTVVVKTVGNIQYISQNYLDTTGTTISNNKANYTNSKDIWAYSNQVKNINISTEINYPENYVKTFDITTEDKVRVIAYLVANGDQNVPYDLYIISNGVIYAPEDSTGLFSFPNVETINGLENIVFDNTVKMTGMFIGNEKLNTVDLSTVDTTNVKDTSYMFHKCFNLNVDKTKFNLENTEVRNNMFVQYLKDEITKDAKTDKNIDFSKKSSSTNGEGVYLRSGTEKDKNPIYYYRGNVAYNNVRFANKCWQMVRTTETGGIKLIYNGVPDSSGNCYRKYVDNAGIGRSKFNTISDYVIGVGYMYGDSPYQIRGKGSGIISSGWVYGSDVEYKDGKYHLKDTYTTKNAWSTDYATVSKKYHYTCFSTENSCETVNYMFYTTNSGISYYELNNGVTIDNIQKEFFVENNDERNKYDSDVKKYVDSWYQNNLVSYTGYLENTIWCNDRNISLLNGLDKNVDITATKFTYFSPYSRRKGSSTDKQAVSLKCSNVYDSFTVSDSATKNAGGNGKLIYPIGMLTSDEVNLAGAAGGLPLETNNNFYLDIDSFWYTMSPYGITNIGVMSFTTDGSGYLDAICIVNNDTGIIRPAISLKNNIDYLRGTGTTTNPYVIAE